MFAVAALLFSVLFLEGVLNVAARVSPLVRYHVSPPWDRFTVPDPVLDHILQGVQGERELYVLLTAILQSGDSKLVRAAEASLRSLAKQARQATLPWQSRPSGHFEPPSD